MRYPQHGTRPRIADAPNAIAALQDEIRRTRDSRYDHRLHAILLVAQGLSCREAAWLLGDAPRTLAYWVRRYEEKGLAGLVDADRDGRRRRLTEDQLQEVAAAAVAGAFHCRTAYRTVSRTMSISGKTNTVMGGEHAAREG